MLEERFGLTPKGLLANGGILRPRTPVRSFHHGGLLRPGVTAVNKTGTAEVVAARGMIREEIRAERAGFDGAVTVNLVSNGAVVESHIVDVLDRRVRRGNREARQGKR